MPKLLETMEGKNTKVNDLAAEKGVDVQIVQQSAVRILGVVGSPAATEALVAYMPQRDCTGDLPPVDLESEAFADFDQNVAVGIRAFSANALGYIADPNPAAIAALCNCHDATRNPADTWGIISALGRIGGDGAFDCLTKVVSTSFYNPEDLPSSDFKYEVRWLGARSWNPLGPARARRRDRGRDRGQRSQGQGRGREGRLEGWHRRARGVQAGHRLLRPRARRLE